MYKRVLIAVLIFMCRANAFCQPAATLDSIDQAYQACLDSGVYMYGCSVNYYAQMDSMLNVVYNSRMKNEDTALKARLKQDERKWLIRRDVYFKKLEKNLDTRVRKYGPVQDDAMIMVDKKARFVRNRVLYLLSAK